MSLAMTLSLFAVSSLTLSVGLLAAWLLRERLSPAAQNRLLRATLTATLAGLALCMIPLPRPASPLFTAPEPTPVSLSRAAQASPAAPAPPFTSASEGRRQTPGTNFPPLAKLLPLLGAAISLLLLLRLVLAYATVIRIARQAQPYVSSLFPDGIATPHAGGKHLRLLTLPESIKTGFDGKTRFDEDALFLADLPLLRPFLLLPANAEKRFSPEAFRAIIAHEAAHRERRDCRWNLAAQIFCCLLWFQPLTWLLWRQLECTAETACDAAALLETACSPRAYADTLLQFAAAQHRAPAGFANVTAPLVRSSLKERLETLMKRPSSSLLPDSAPLRSGIALAAALVALGGATLFGVRTALPANAQPPAPSATTGVATNPLAEPLDADIHNATILQAVKLAARAQRLQIVPAEWEANGLTGSIASLRISEQPLRHALSLIIRASNQATPPRTKFDFRVEGETLHLIAVQVDNSGIPLTPVTVKFGPGPLGDGLTALMQAIGETAEIGENLPDNVRFDFKNVPLSKALDAVVQQYRASHPKHGEMVVYATPTGVRVLTLAQQRKEAVENQKYAEIAVEKSKVEWRKCMAQLVTLDFKNVTLQIALEQLFRCGGIVNFLIDPNVGSSLVSVTCKDATVEQALKQIIAASKTPLQYKVVNGVIMVSPAPTKP